MYSYFRKKGKLSVNSKLILNLNIIFYQNLMKIILVLEFKSNELEINKYINLTQYLSFTKQY